MADSVNMTQFIAEVRRLGGFETLDEANAFITDAEIESRGNRELRKVFLALVRARGANYFRKDPPNEFSTVANTESYTLPTDLFELISVSRKTGTNEWEPLLDFNESERHDFDLALANTATGTPSHYQLRAGKIAFAPIPSTVETIRLNYVPKYSPITKAGGETFDGVCGFEEWAIWETIISFKDKDKDDASLAIRNAQFWAGEVESMAREREANLPTRVQRVRRTRRRGWYP